MTKRLLTITCQSDVHADLVGQRVEARGERMFRLNLDEFPERFALALELARERWHGSLTHLPTNETLDLADIGAVWMRKKADYSFLSKQLAPQERAYADAETRHLLLGFLYSLDCYWMSHPLALRSASWKGEQLQRAARLGFAVPPSLTTNRRGSVDAFMAAHQDVVFKPLSSPTLAAEEVGSDDRIAGSLMTTRITAEHDDILDAVAELPCFFQRNIPKQYELRVTVIGDKVFAARIHSQDDPRTATDWRDMSAEILYEKAVLPDEVERRCLDYVHSYGPPSGRSI